VASGWQIVGGVEADDKLLVVGAGVVERKNGFTMRLTYCQAGGSVVRPYTEIEARVIGR
jgi:hypothetical protein